MIVGNMFVVYANYNSTQKMSGEHRRDEHESRLKDRVSLGGVYFLLPIGIWHDPRDMMEIWLLCD